MNPIPVPDLGAYLREQRQAARLSLRQLSDVAGVSNPYLSQIERGLKKPSAEILQQLAKGLRVSAESLYVRAGILEEKAESETGHQPTVAAAILADPRLTDRQRRVLLDVYASLVGDDDEATPPAAPPATARTAGATTTAPVGAAGQRSGSRSARAPAGRAARRPAKKTTPSTKTTPTPEAP